MAHVTTAPAMLECYPLVGGNARKQQARHEALVVRLTDASLKSLQNAIAESKRTNLKPPLGYVEIQSSGNNEGVINFGGSSKCEHHFALSDVQRDLGPNGQLEAVTQKTVAFKNGKTGVIMHSKGSVTKRLQVAATAEDTIESTKERAKQANEEMRRNTAKVLKGPASGITAHKKLLKNVATVRASTGQRPLTPLSHTTGSPSSVLAMKNPKAASGPVTPAQSTKQLVGNEVSKRPLRQRIMYRLIVRPSTPSDLSAKLKSEGLSIEDQRIFDSILEEVGQVQFASDGAPTSSCIYELKKALYGCIKPDTWPFYSQLERNSCRRALLKAKNISAHCTGNESTDDTDQSQRVKTKVGYRAPPPKRAADSSEKGRAQTSIAQSANYRAEPSPVAMLDSSPPSKRSAVNAGQTERSALNESDESQQSVTPSNVSDQYPPIQTMEQRQRYKADFDVDYPKYLDVYEKLRSFALLVEKLREEMESSPDRPAVEKEVLTTYAKFQSTDIKSLLRQHEELKRQLHIIKTRVKEYDDNQPTA